jgi:HEAT repeat protein
MDREEALRFLRAHQPLPPEDLVDEATIREFDMVRAFFAANPDAECIPLFLNAFGDGMGLGVYQLCDDVFRAYPQSSLTPHLADALASPHRGVRWWAAHWAMHFSAPELVAPLVQVLATQEDDDAHYFCLAALQFIWEEHSTREALAALQRRARTETDPERMELLWDALSGTDER